jgi:hypothetical protein
VTVAPVVKVRSLESVAASAPEEMEGPAGELGEEWRKAVNDERSQGGRREVADLEDFDFLHSEMPRFGERSGVGQRCGVRGTIRIVCAIEPGDTVPMGSAVISNAQVEAEIRTARST